MLVPAEDVVSDALDHLGDEFLLRPEVAEQRRMRHPELFRHGSQGEFGEAMLEDVLHRSGEEFGSAMLMAKRPTVDHVLGDAHVDEF